jgi:DNA-binding NarL/FixJ family response regulator
VKITVLLVDDHDIVREGLRALLASQPDMEVVGEACNGSEGARKAKDLAPNVVVLDLLMPESNGVEAARQIRALKSSTKVLILSSSDNLEHVRQLIDAGAAGYVTKQTAGEDLFRAIREVWRGKRFLSPALSKRLLQHTTAQFVNGQPLTEPVHLTPRELQVLKLIAAGQSNKMIADSLGISIKTVEKHRQQLMEKTNLHEVASLTRHAISTGAIECTPQDQPEEDGSAI